MKGRVICQKLEKELRKDARSLRRFQLLKRLCDSQEREKNYNLGLRVQISYSQELVN